MGNSDIRADGDKGYTGRPKERKQLCYAMVFHKIDEQ